MDYDARTILAAIDVNRTYKVHYWNALIAATMSENNTFCIYTENGDFYSIPWLTVINPFELGEG